MLWQGRQWCTCFEHLWQSIAYLLSCWFLLCLLSMLSVMSVTWKQCPALLHSHTVHYSSTVIHRSPALHILTHSATYPPNVVHCSTLLHNSTVLWYHSATPSTLDGNHTVLQSLTLLHTVTVCHITPNCSSHSVIECTLYHIVLQIFSAT